MVSQFIDLLYKIKHNNSTEKQKKYICSLNQKDKSDADPLVDLETSCAQLRVTGKHYDSRHLGTIG